MTSSAIDLLAMSIARDIVAKIIPTETPRQEGDSDYDVAGLRYEIANNAYPVLCKIADELKNLANAEVESAVANLRQYEESPGIPKVEYRRQFFHTELDEV